MRLEGDNFGRRMIGKKMKRIIVLFTVLVGMLGCGNATAETFDWLRAAQGAVKVYQSYSLSDADVRNYVAQYIKQLDAQSKVAPANSPYTIRLKKLTKGLTSVNGVPLNFKVYMTKEVNAFACADGSVRVYSGLMDLMSDDEILGVIGHEIGHVANNDTRDAMKAALKTSALRDALSAGSGWVAALSDSQFGALGETLMNSSYSKKQESAADDYGYNFLKKAGKNPWAMAQAFTKLKSLSGSSNQSRLSSALNGLFSDHPSTDKRIKAMEKKARKDGFAVPSGYTPMTK